MNLIILLILVINVNSLIPMPKQFIKGDKSIKITKECSLSYQFKHDDFPSFVIDLLTHYYQLMMPSHCSFTDSFGLSNEQGMIKLSIFLQNDKQLYGVDTTEQESYILEIDENLNVKIDAKTHWGLARALNTLHQLTDKQEINNVPLFIQDKPAYSYRGILIDSARHYLPVKLIEKTIDALAMNSMNTVHWHITDDESFPLLLTEYPNITHSTKYSENSIYTINDTTRIVEYASIRGVQIIPGFDSPGHSMSWGMTKELANIMMMCGTTIKQYGVLDPTLEETYTVLESILKDFYQMFKKVKYVNFAGDEVSQTCWNQRPSIKLFMEQNNIKDYYELQSYYRRRQKQIWRNIINAEQDIIYLYRKEDNLPLDNDDIIHWWGYTNQLPDVADKPNRIILMDYYPLFIDAGFGNAFGNPYSVYHTWKEIYKWTPSLPEGSLNTIIGGEVPLWGETNNPNTHFNKLFMRTSVMAEILWNPKQKETEQFSDFVKRLIEMEDRMTKYGYPVTPVTHGYCRKNTEICFPVLDAQQAVVK